MNAYVNRNDLHFISCVVNTCCLCRQKIYRRLPTLLSEGGIRLRDTFLFLLALVNTQDIGRSDELREEFVVKPQLFCKHPSPCAALSLPSKIFSFLLANDSHLRYSSSHWNETHRAQEPRGRFRGAEELLYGEAGKLHFELFFFRESPARFVPCL